MCVFPLHESNQTREDRRLAVVAMVDETAKRDLDIQKHLSSGKNPRGIPTVVFIVSKASHPAAGFFI